MLFKILWIWNSIKILFYTGVKIFYKGPFRKYCRLCRPAGFGRTTQLCCDSVRAAITIYKLTGIALFQSELIWKQGQNKTKRAPGWILPINCSLLTPASIHKVLISYLLLIFKGLLDILKHTNIWIIPDNRKIITECRTGS